MPMQLILSNPRRKRRTNKARRHSARRRRLSPAARRAAIANLARARSARRPRRSTSRRATVAPALAPRRRRSRRSAAGAPPMASRRRRGSSGRRRSSRRSGSPFGGSRRGFAFIPPGGLPAIGATAAGFIVPDMVLSALKDKAPAAGSWQRIAAVAAVGAAGYYFGKKYSPAIATGFGIGCFANAALTAYAKFRAGQGSNLAPIEVNNTAPTTSLRGIGRVDGVAYNGLKGFNMHFNNRLSPVG